MYTRHVKGGGMHILQLIGLGIVLTLSKNKCRSNGDTHGWKLSTKLRKNTAL